MMNTVIESYAWAHTDFLVQITFDRHPLSELIQVPRQMYFMNGIVQHVVQRNILTHVETIVPVLDPLEKFCYSECGQGISHYWITAICVVHGEFPVFYCAIEYLYQKNKKNRWYLQRQYPQTRPSAPRPSTVLLFILYHTNKKSGPSLQPARLRIS